MHLILASHPEKHSTKLFDSEKREREKADRVVLSQLEGEATGEDHGFQG